MDREDSGVGSGGVDGLSGGVGGLGGNVRLDISRVGDIGDVAGVGVGNVVPHSLDAAVGESHGVLAVGGVAIPGLVLLEVGAGVVVVDGVGVVVDGGAVLVGGAGVGGGVGGNGAGRGGGGGSGQEKNSGEGLKSK